MDCFKIFASVAIVLACSLEAFTHPSARLRSRLLANSLLGLTCPTNGGCYPHPEKCELYYCCTADFMPIQYRCPGQQLFDLRYNGCNWSEMTQCQNRTRPDGYPAPPPLEGTTPPPYPCPVEVQDENYPDANDCSAFYRCVHGISHHHKCAKPLLFNVQTGRCGYEEYVDCGTRPKPHS